MLFLFIYVFFVVLFLPSFYKKFRVRVLVRNLIKLVAIVSLRNILVSLTFFLDFFRVLNLQILGFVRSLLFYFNVRRTNMLGFFTSSAMVCKNSSTYLLNKNLFVIAPADGIVRFVKFWN